MKNNKGRICLILLIAFCTIFLLSSCKENNSESEIAAQDIAVIHNDKYGGFYVDVSIEDFNSLGFEYGDSVDIFFSDGQKISDIPYYNGYYTKFNEPIICAYPGYERIIVCRNNGDDLFEECGLDDNVTATLRLNKKGKYIDIQNTMSMVYENDRSAFDTDEAFANFRPLSGGKLKENIIYRSASPVDNTYNRASCVDSLIGEAGIGYVINLSDNEEKMRTHLADPAYNSPYVEKLNNEGKILFLDMSTSFGSSDYIQSVARGLSEITKHEGPYLVHCMEGKDRTGFVAMLIEALCGADYEELLHDYMITYDNYYGINKTDNKTSYDAIVEIRFEEMICFLCGTTSIEEVKKVDMQEKACEYLLSGGMTEKEIYEVINILTR